MDPRRDATACYSITGDGTGDVYFVDLSGFSRGSWDILLHLFECGSSAAAASYGPADDADLRSCGLEEMAYAIYDAGWMMTYDADTDGCSESARLWWDADVSNDLSRDVQAEVQARETGTEEDLIDVG